MIYLFWLIFYMLTKSILNPYLGFMKWIQIRPNDMDPTGSRSTTLVEESDPYSTIN